MLCHPYAAMQPLRHSAAVQCEPSITTCSGITLYIWWSFRSQPLVPFVWKAHLLCTSFLHIRPFCNGSIFLKEWGCWYIVWKSISPTLTLLNTLLTWRTCDCPVTLFLQLKLQRWNKKKISTVDLRGHSPSHEHMDHPQEVCV